MKPTKREYCYRVTVECFGVKGRFEMSTHVVAGNRRGALSRAWPCGKPGKVIKVERVN